MTRFSVLVPAHDEAAVVANVVGDLVVQDYPDDRYEVVVIADRCTDDTAAVARDAGATVVERADGRASKGAALDWRLAATPTAPGEAVVVFDADNRIPPTVLGRLSDELEAGHPVLQAYLGVSNPDGSVMATASALTYWAGNRMVQLARTRLRWSADLGGTGMCFGPDALAELGGFGDGLTEDQGAMARLVERGMRVRWLHDVRLADEKPERVGDAVIQRARWATGKRSVARGMGWRLVRAAWSQRSWAPLDAAIRLFNPGRSFLAFVAGVLAAAAWLTGSDLFLSPALLTAVAVATVLAPMAFLARDGVSGHYLLRYPLVVLIALLWLPVRVVGRLAGGGWRRTPRRAESA